MIYLGAALALLALAAGFGRRARRAAELRGGLTEDQIRDIERLGRIERDDEPLDLAEAREEEERFWRQERWDDADQW